MMSYVHPLAPLSLSQKAQRGLQDGWPRVNECVPFEMVKKTNHIQVLNGPKHLWSSRVSGFGLSSLAVWFQGALWLGGSALPSDAVVLLD